MVSSCPSRASDNRNTDVISSLWVVHVLWGSVIRYCVWSWRSESYKWTRGSRFLTVCPRRHSWCCTQSKAHKVMWEDWKELEKEILSSTFTPQHTWLITMSGGWEGSIVLDAAAPIQTSEKCQEPVSDTVRWSHKNFIWTVLRLLSHPAAGCDIWLSDVHLF